MTDARIERLTAARDEVQQHLFDELIPFWLSHGVDDEHGGFLTYLDRQGMPTGETMKTLICQTRLLYTAASAHRAHLGEGRFLRQAEQGFDFLLHHFWDDEHTGWFWTCAGDGVPENRSKLTYGQSFAIYALSEYAMASGDTRALEMAVETYKCLNTLAADETNGGYREFMEEDWRPKRPGVYGGDRKSMDVHMHLMEAFTNLYEATGEDAHRAGACAVIDLLFDKIVHPEFGTGVAQFSLDWQPLRAILFRDVWGADRDVDDAEGRPMNNTSFGHNVEFAWLLRHSIDLLGLELEDYKPALKKLYDHCVEYGIDWERGGVYCEGPHDGPARERNKEFWQQAECMNGFLDALLLFDDDRYLDAYEAVHRFVMDHMIVHDVGEWLPLFDENNQPLANYLGHAWKNNYHTVRAMIGCEQRLSKLLA